MFSLTCLPQWHKFELFIFLLEDTDMVQNNSVFVWKTLNYSRRRANLRNDMNDVTNLKSLGFTWKRIASLLGIFPVYMRHRLPWFLWCCFWSPYLFNSPFYGSRWFTRNNPKKLSPFTLLPPPLANSWVTDGCWFSSIDPFTMFAKSIKRLHYLFRGTLVIHDSRVMHYSNWLSLLF